MFLEGGRGRILRWHSARLDGVSILKFNRFWLKRNKTQVSYYVAATGMIREEIGDLRNISRA